MGRGFGILLSLVGMSLVVALGACSSTSSKDVVEVPADVAATDVTGDVVLDAGGDSATVDAPCVPSCTGKECGGDGCGGSCGLCCGEVLCVAGQCDCEPDCDAKECGEDGCGGYCFATEPWDCQQPLPDDSDLGCSPGLLCDPATFACLDCISQCDGKQCGDDGCGGSCGECPCAGEECCAAAVECGNDAQCFVPPLEGCSAVADCVGSDVIEACSGPCEAAADVKSWVDYTALTDCFADCGPQDWPPDPDGCEADCYELQVQCFNGDATCSEIYDCLQNCPEGDVTCFADCPAQGTAEAQLQLAALVNCLVVQCPGDATEECFQAALEAECLVVWNVCQGCESSCLNKDCGEDGCGGSCGSCGDETECIDFKCVGCLPHCDDKECGPDGCGGSCGECPEGESCQSNTCEGGASPQCQACEQSCQAQYGSCGSSCSSAQNSCAGSCSSQMSSCIGQCQGNPSCSSQCQSTYSSCMGQCGSKQGQCMSSCSQAINFCMSSCPC
jgi:hypothetical protein